MLLTPEPCILCTLVLNITVDATVNTALSVVCVASHWANTALYFITLDVTVKLRSRLQLPQCGKWSEWKNFITNVLLVDCYRLINEAVITSLVFFYDALRWSRSIEHANFVFVSSHSSCVCRSRSRFDVKWLYYILESEHAQDINLHSTRC